MMEMQAWLAWGWLGLFGASFVSATLLPLASEGLLALLVWQGGDPWAAWAAASAGNTLGGMTNYWLGLRGKGLADGGPRARRLRGWLDGRGAWTAALTWLPGVGDLLGLALGWLGAPWRPVLGWMFVGKAGRYAVLVGLALWAGGA